MTAHKASTGLICCSGPNKLPLLVLPINRDPDPVKGIDGRDRSVVVRGEALVVERQHIGIDRFEVVHELLVQLPRFFRLSFCQILRFAQVDF